MIKLLPIVIFMVILIGCGTRKEPITSDTNSSVSEIEVKKQSLFKKLEENNHLLVNERIALYYQLKKENLNDYNFSSDTELNQYGYSLLYDDKVGEAIEIFKVLLKEFPNNANAYDSMGEAYMKAGKDELAILNYEKSVEMDPKNTHAVDQITIMKGLEILVTNWGKEFFHFPIHFAPEIPYTGVEEVVFPRNWRKPDSADFWSYVFVWALDNKTEVSAIELENTLKMYFDGLMDGLSKDKYAEVIKTSATFQRNTDEKDTVDFIGKLTIFDAFATNKPLNLNARIYSDYCPDRKKLILLFRFSPQEFDQPTWDYLRTVKVRSTVCEK